MYDVLWIIIQSIYFSILDTKDLVKMFPLSRLKSLKDFAEAKFYIKIYR